ncbi:MAG: 50S ribosomal protein L2 [Chitinivibrionales bacterium]|nr:50S ribosomal protein L2 [Chitinivibrionales bacterium]
MPLKTYRPISPVLRYKTMADFSVLTTDTPYKPLLLPKRRQNGRNNNGRITVRHWGGGAKQFIRIVDFKRDKFNIPGTVETIEYDPGRTCYLALILYADGERRYIPATINMKVGQKIIAADECDMVEGNCMPLKKIPLGTPIHNIELRVGKGGQIGRSAGNYAEIVAKENNMVQVKLPSSEMRSIPDICRATIGQVSNLEHMNVVIGSAGRTRHKGVRPTVRGVAMNPVDHPMGGGEGRSKSGGGRQHPVSPWGQKSKGLHTRRPKKLSSKYIISRRGK